MTVNFKLSIIIPVFNGKKYLENTVLNLLSSSYQNLELLLIDDGSTDESLTLCQKLAVTDARIKVYHKENSGISDTRNYGLKHATGDYIAFCDQDDEVSEEMYRKMLDRIAADKSQVALCGCYRQKRNGGRVVFEKYTNAIYDRPNITEALLLPLLFRGFSAFDNQDICIYGTIWKCIISRQLIISCKMKFCSFVSYEDDLLMLLQLLCHADRISTLSDILYYWNTNPNSEIHNCTNRYLSDLESKQHKLTNYELTLLINHGIPSKIIKDFTYVQQCRNALLQLDNLAALSRKKNAQGSVSFCTKIKNLRNCESISYIQSTPNPIPPQKGFVRNTIIIWLLRKKHVTMAYVVNKLINAVRFFVEKYQITEKLERRLKGRQR